jgi:hypothetical protein
MYQYVSQKGGTYKLDQYESKIYSPAHTLTFTHMLDGHLVFQ